MRRLAVLAIHAATFVLLLWWTWRRWPDPLVDFGRELYLPWQINAGQVLYRDLASLFGPLSPYVNALWFRLFGSSLLTLAACNLVIFGATVGGIYHLVRVSTDRITASAAGLATLLLFGFSQYVPVGNYNFVTPYSHEATHGLALSVAALVLLHRSIATRSRLSSAMAGVCFGLVVLTKPEIAFAATAAVLAAWLATHALGGRDRSELASHVALFIAMTMVPALLFFLFFATKMETPAALRATAGAWIPLLETGIAGNDFYRRVMGLNAPAANLSSMLLAFGAFIAFAAAAVTVSWTMKDSAPSSLARRLLRISLIAGGLLLWSKGTFPRALPLIVVTTLAAVTILFVRARRERDQAVRLMPLLVFSAFALVLLAKMGLNARVVHYGFYLAMPAMAVAVALAVWMIPHVVASRRTSAAARSVRHLALWMIATAIVPYAGRAFVWNQSKTLPVGSEGDRFYASTLDGQWHGRAVREAVHALEQTAPPGATLAVLPEGVMVNYLLRLESPLRVVNLMPPELMAFGEDDVLRSLAARPPDFVLLVRKDTREYGYPPFGSDAMYGLRILTWIDERYENVSVIRQDQASDSEVGMRLLRRRR